MTARSTGRALLAGAVTTLAVAAVQAPPTQAATAMPALQMPFPCGQSWNGDSDNSRAHEGRWEIDFNRGATVSADRGDTVVAAARGKVVTSAHQGSTNRYGNLVTIDHGGGWSTYYAHLTVRSVKKGATVEQGQKIGTVGSTTKPGNRITEHLHFEVRGAGRWPSSVEPAAFDGRRFAYPNQTLRSRNCADPQKICGPGFRVNDRAYLSRGGTHQGTVYLTWNGKTKNNCVVTVKHVGRSAQSPMSAYLEPAGAKRTTDKGSYFSYAGPVKKLAPRCIRWGGSIGAATYNSPSEHC